MAHNLFLFDTAPIFMKHVYDNKLKIDGNSGEVAIAKFYYSYFIYMKEVEKA